MTRKNRTSFRWMATIVAGIALEWSAVVAAAELRPETVTAFNRYVSVSEAQRAAASAFLWVDGDGPAERRALAEVRRSGFAIAQLTTRDGGRDLSIPDGLVHHWLGVVFVPGATVDQALALLQDYDRHGEIYRPAVARSRLVSRDGDTFKLFLRFFMKKGITVVMNSDHEAIFTRHGPMRAQSRIYSHPHRGSGESGHAAGTRKACGSRRRVPVEAQFLLALHPARRRRVPAMRVHQPHPRHSVRPRLDRGAIRHQHPARNPHLYARDDAQGPECALTPRLACYRVSFRYLIRCGWSASAPRRRFLSAS